MRWKLALNARDHHDRPLAGWDPLAHRPTTTKDETVALDLTGPAPIPPEEGRAPTYGMDDVGDPQRPWGHVA